MSETIRYYFLEGRATYVVNSANPPSNPAVLPVKKNLGDFIEAVLHETEVPLSIAEYHDFILNKMQNMKCVVNDTMRNHRKCQDYVSEE
jgi:hypothetical protein